MRQQRERKNYSHPLQYPLGRRPLRPAERGRREREVEALRRGPAGAVGGVGSGGPAVCAGPNRGSERGVAVSGVWAEAKSREEQGSRRRRREGRRNTQRIAPVPAAGEAGARRAGAREPSGRLRSMIDH